jgi:F-type H+-transporting ATPase subunit b
MDRCRTQNLRIVWISLFLFVALFQWPAHAKSISNSTTAFSSQPAESHFGGPSEHSSEPPAWKEILFKWVNLGILLGVLVFFLRKPALKFFAERSEQIRKALEEARAAREAAEQEVAKVMARVQQLDQEVAHLKNEAVAQAEAERQRILEAARHEAERIKIGAQEEIGLLVKNARQELREHSAALVVQMAEDKIKSEIRPEHQEPLFKKFMGSLPSKERSK